MTKVLIEHMHGLGDIVQASIVLKHLRKYRTDWEVDVVCGRGKHTALRGLCHRVYHDQQDSPNHGDYNTVVSLGWYENYNSYTDRPCTKVTNCLQEVFGIQYDHSLSRYEVQVSADAYDRAAKYLQKCGCTFNGSGGSRVRHNAVIMHYEGNTSPQRKNLLHWQARAICDYVIQAGRIPIILDWDHRSPLPDQRTIFNPDADEKMLWDFGSGDAEMIAALISLAEAYVGIDSGPDKIASATDTHAIICWTGHHPMQFHDPAPNTLHLIPSGHKGMSPVSGNEAMNVYFLEHYRTRVYEGGEHSIVSGVQGWLQGILGAGPPEPQPMKYVLPNGIGDVMWALLKIKSVANGKPIDIILSGDSGREIDQRSVPFCKRFPFIRHCEVLDVPVLVDKRDHPTDDNGRYRYHADGEEGRFHYLVPNSVLEAGQRIETWLPEHPTDWSVIDQFDWSGTERGKELGRILDPFVALYLGPESGNTNEGHNRDWLWEPKHWIELALGFKERGMTIAVVGASYDRSFYERYVKEGVEQAGMTWIDLLGRFEIGETYAFLKQSKCYLGYQSGLTMVSSYMGVKCVCWWRPEGNSCHPERLVSFDERMATAWVNPAHADNYIGCIYRRETPEMILAEIDKRGWLK
jgi:ADP-heptose:LPS heptosyltransferase